MNEGRVRRLAAVLITVAACGGGGAGSSASFTGTVDGTTFHPVEAISAPGTITMSDRSGLCDLATRSIEPRSSHVLAIGVAEDDRKAVHPGTYTVVDPHTANRPLKAAFAVFVTVDAVCTPPQRSSSASGTIVLTKVVDGAYTGTFDIVFQGGDHVSGSFDSASCSGLAGWGLGALTCG